MDITLSKDIQKILLTLILIIIPALLILVGVIINFENALYYLLTIFWFGMGVTFYGALQ